MSNPTVVITFPQQCKSLQIYGDPDSLLLGRGNATGIDSQYVSRHQAKIIVEGGKVFIERIGTNPSYRNGQELPKNERVEVLQGDLFSLIKASDQEFPFTITLPSYSTNTPMRARIDQLTMDLDDPSPSFNKHIDNPDPISSSAIISESNQQTSDSLIQPRYRKVTPPPIRRPLDVDLFSSASETSDDENEIGRQSRKSDENDHATRYQNLDELDNVEFSDESDLLGSERWSDEE